MSLFTGREDSTGTEGPNAFIELCEERWRKAGGGQVTKQEAEWLEWARAEARRMEPFAKGYPDPLSDGKLERSAIAVGGP